MTKASRHLARVLSASVFVCSLAVMVGWVIESGSLVQMLPGLAPMRFHTALCFALLSSSIFILRMERYRSLVISSIVLCLSIAMLSCIEHLLKTNIGFDTLFVDPSITDRTVYPGRMSLTTSIAFICSSLSLLGILRGDSENEKFLWVTLALVTLSLSSAALIEYVAQLRPSHGHTILLGMALHTTICHLLISAAILARSPLRIIEVLSRGRIFLFFLPVIVGVAVAVIAWQGILSLYVELQKESLSHDSQVRAEIIRNEFALSESVLNAIRLFYLGSNEVSEEEFQTFVAPLIDSSGTLMAVDWTPRISSLERSRVEEALKAKAGRSFQQLDGERRLTTRGGAEVYFPVTYTYPRIQDGRAFGFDHYSDPLRTVAMDYAAETDSLGVTVPFTLFRLPRESDTPTDVLFILPVVKAEISDEIESAKDSRVEGFVIGVVRTSHLLEKLFQGFDDVGLNASLFYEGGGKERVLTFKKNSEHFQLPLDTLQDFELFSHESRLQIGNSHWILKFTPTLFYLRNQITTTPSLLLTVFLFSTYLLTIYLFLLQQAKEKALTSKDRLARANDALREREEWFAQLSRTSPVGIFRTDADGGCVYVNQAWCKLSGLEFEEAVGDGWREAVHPEDRDYVFANWKEYAIRGESFQVEFRFLHKDGSVRWTVANSKPVLDAERKIIGHVGTNFDLTEKKRSEEEIRGLSAMQRAIIDNAGYAMISGDTNGLITSFNPAAEKMLGYRAEEMVGKKTPECFHDVHEVVKKAKVLSEVLGREVKPGFQVFAEAAQTGVESICEWTYIRKDGSKLLVLLNVTPIHDDVGKLTGYLGVAVDITERARLRKELEEHITRLQLTTEGAGIGAWEYHFESESFKFSEKFIEMLGFTQLPSEHDALRDLIHPDYRQSVDELLSSSDVGDDHLKCELKIRDAAGEYRWMLWLGKIIARRRGGGPSQIVGIQLEITDLKTVQQDLALAKAQTEAFIRHAPASVAMFDRDMRYVGYSNKWLTDYGLVGQDLIGRNHYDVFPEISDAWKEIHRRCLAGEVEKNPCEEFVRLNGQRQCLQWEVRPWMNGDGTVGGIAMFTEDITEKQLILEKLEEAKKAAEGASQAKAAFLANMSHEIRTPLTAVIGYAEQLLDNDISPEEHLKFTHTIVQSSEHLLELINDILDFSKMDAGMVRPSLGEASLFEMVDVVESGFKKKAEERGIGLYVDYHFPLPTKVVTDALRVKQVLINLVGNAIKFTEKGEVRLNVQYLRESNELLFIVKDTGIGLTKEQRPKLFKDFSQADDSTTKRFGGTGLGLSLSKKFVEMLGGAISVESAFGFGSKFQVQVPLGKLGNVKLVDAVPKTAYRTEITHDQVHLEGKVLVVEDTAVNQKLFTRMLEKLGLEVELAENGKVGLEKAQTGEFGLVLMDMQMPVMDGYTATKLLRQGKFQIPIVGCTADASSSGKTRCLKVGCNDVLVKPFSPQKFSEILHKHLGLVSSEE
ncbi:MAG: PAS domain S-box protein [Bdellovibrionales bacterium]|nr:PAS domain S-box protein [Bdellovibrionales bacterium]